MISTSGAGRAGAVRGQQKDSASLEIPMGMLTDCNVADAGKNGQTFCEIYYTLSFCSLLTTKIEGIATATPHISYLSNDFSIFCFCSFKSFCFSYRLLRSLRSSFMRSNCALTQIPQRIA